MQSKSNRTKMPRRSLGPQHFHSTIHHFIVFIQISPKMFISFYSVCHPPVARVRFIFLPFVTAIAPHDNAKRMCPSIAREVIYR